MNHRTISRERQVKAAGASRHCSTASPPPPHYQGMFICCACCTVSHTTSRPDSGGSTARTGHLLTDRLSVPCLRFYGLNRVMLCAGDGSGGGGPPFSCLLCGRVYKRRDNLTRHQRYECLTSEPQFLCSICPYKAKQKVHLKSHMAIRHGQFFPNVKQ